MARQVGDRRGERLGRDATPRATCRSARIVSTKTRRDGVIFLFWGIFSLFAAAWTNERRRHPAGASGCGLCPTLVTALRNAKRRTPYPRRHSAPV
jgi:hypothetical protein